MTTSLVHFTQFLKLKTLSWEQDTHTERPKADMFNDCFVSNYVSKRGLDVLFEIKKYLLCFIIFLNFNVKIKTKHNMHILLQDKCE